MTKANRLEEYKMVLRDTPWPAGTPCWVDLGSDDPVKAQKFYGALLGWESVEGPPEAGGYAIAEVQGHPVAGLGPKMGGPEQPTFWTTYLATEDADATAAKITAAGGQVLAAPFDVMDVGRMAVATDPSGALFGLWQSHKHTGFNLANEPGSVCWNENMSRSFEANKAFYTAAFGYEYDDMSSEDFSYATFKTTGDPMGGMGDLGTMAPAQTPPHWMVYFGVSDTDSALATVTELGGAIMRPAWDTPYGRMAIVSDDQGAVFALISMAQATGQ